MELRLVSVSEEEARGQKDGQEAVRDAQGTYKLSSAGRMGFLQSMERRQQVRVCSVQGGACTEQFILQKVEIIGNIYVKGSDRWKG